MTITKIEIHVGSKLTIDHTAVQCITSATKSCKGCIFLDKNRCCDVKDTAEQELYLACNSFDRSDKQNVIFKEVEE